MMGQYKGPLNPQAHGQNASESLRVFHGGDNMYGMDQFEVRYLWNWLRYIETFAGAEMESYLKEKLIGFAFGCGVLVRDPRP